MKVLPKENIHLFLLITAMKKGSYFLILLKSNLSKIFSKIEVICDE